MIDTVANVAATAALLLRATADSLDTFSRSLQAQQVAAPDVIPAWVDEESDL